MKDALLASATKASRGLAVSVWSSHYFWPEGARVYHVWVLVPGI